MEIKIKSKFIKIGQNIKQGDILTILDEGTYVPKTWQGKTREVLEFKVELKGEEKVCAFNNTTQKGLMKAWSTDSKQWIGKKVKANIIASLIGGEMKDVLVLTPADEKDIKKAEDDIPVIEEGEGTFEKDPNDIDPKEIPF